MNSRKHKQLDSELRALHGGSDSERLARLHLEAADLMNSPQARRFHLTHAWVYALVAGDQQLVEKLEQQLRQTGGL